MKFKNNQSIFWYMLFLVVISIIAGMLLENKLKLPEYAIMLINIGLYISAYAIYRIRIRFNSIRRIERQISKLPYKHQQLKLYFEKYIPETRKKYPKLIYKYVHLNDGDPLEREILNSFSSQIKLENWIVNSTKRTSNENKLFSLLTGSLWFTRSNSATLNDPFEGRQIVYDDVVYPINELEAKKWKKYAEDIRDHLFLCCFSKNNDSPPMWANYANNYKGYCLEFEIVDATAMWEVDYSYAKNLPNHEFHGLKNDLWEERITVKEAAEYIKQLHILWATTKYKDWEYENEIRALFFNLAKDMNISYQSIGIKLAGIIMGHNCDKEYRKFLSYFANKLSIPIKITSLDNIGTDALNIINYTE